MPRQPLLVRSVEDSLVLTLFDVANELAKLGERISSRAGLTTQQWLMLLQIAGDPNFATPKGGPSRYGPGVMASEIARARGVSRANVSMLVAQLLRMGLVSQEEHPGDRRRKHLALTEAGRRALASIEPARRESNQGLFADLPPARRRQLLGSLRACLERLWQADRTRDAGRVPATRVRRRRH